MVRPSAVGGEVVISKLVWSFGMVVSIDIVGSVVGFVVAASKGVITISVVVWSISFVVVGLVVGAFVVVNTAVASSVVG